MIFMRILITLILGVSTGAFKILVVYPFASFSHQRAIMALTERLVKDGHELFVISPNVVNGLEQHTNYTHVDLSFAYEFFKNQNKDGAMNFQSKYSKWELLKLSDALANIIKTEFENEAVLRFIRRAMVEKIKFDVAILEILDIPLTCALTRLISGSTPIISMTTINTDITTEDRLGSITHMSFTPNMLSQYTDRMTLWERLENWYFNNVFTNKFGTSKVLAAKRYMRENFGAEKERLVDGCLNNASLSLISSNSLYFYPRLLGPNIIEVGPLHLKSPKKLPKNLQDWLDGAEKGVIFFSLGSNMRSESLPLIVRGNFLKIFSELPVGYRVLWKWELDGKIPGQSDNILTQKWMPQESILAHPKVRVFITQGGLQSFQEAVHYGVPTVGIPWFGDQEQIVSKMVDAGIGVELPPSDLHSYEKIKVAIEKVLYDERFFKNMQRLSAISHDFTAQAMDKAVFWVEHVARHGGASHLRPATADTTLFQFFCLDIITVLLVLSLTLLFVTYRFLRYLMSLVFRDESTSKVKES